MSRGGARPGAGRPAKSAETHLLENTFRRDRHSAPGRSGTGLRPEIREQLASQAGAYLDTVRALIAHVQRRPATANALTPVITTLTEAAMRIADELEEGERCQE